MGFVNKIKNKANFRRSISNRIRLNKKLTKIEKAEPTSKVDKQRYSAQVNSNPKIITIDSLVDAVDGLAQEQMRSALGLACGTVTTVAGGTESVDLSIVPSESICRFKRMRGLGLGVYSWLDFIILRFDI